MPLLSSVLVVIHAQLVVLVGACVDQQNDANICNSRINMEGSRPGWISNELRGVKQRMVAEKARKHCGDRGLSLGKREVREELILTPAKVDDNSTIADDELFATAVELVTFKNQLKLQRSKPMESKLSKDEMLKTLEKLRKKCSNNVNRWHDV
jgi:hypothetical protein